MLRKLNAGESEEDVLRNLHEQCVAEMLADSNLMEEERQELLRQLALSDEDWKPVELPRDAEPVSETIIKLRQGERG